MRYALNKYHNSHKYKFLYSLISKFHLNSINKIIDYRI